MTSGTTPRKVRRKQIPFFSVPTFLQIKIAEKMEFFDQINFESSSRYCRDIVDSVKHAAVVDVVQLSPGYTRDIEMKALEGTRKMGNWTMAKPHIRQNARLPRFRLNKIYLNRPNYFKEFMELFGKTEFIKQDLFLGLNQLEAAETTPFFKLLKIFPVKECEIYRTIDVDLFFNPKFQQIETIKLNSNGVPYEALLQLKSTTITLSHRTYNRPDPCIATLLLQQWARKERDIKKLVVHTYGHIDCEILLPQLLPTMDVRKFVVRKPKLRLLLEFMEILNLENVETKHDFLYSLGRGDKKLLLFVDPQKYILKAIEYVTLKGSPTTKRITHVDLS